MARWLSVLLVPLLVAMHCLFVWTKRVCVVGGSGRVGGSCVSSLLRRKGDILSKVTVVGRSRDNFNEFIRRNSKNSVELKNKVSFDSIDISDAPTMRQYISTNKFDLVVNTAGPFQGLDDNELLKCCLASGTNYIDVCDDIELSRQCRSEEYQLLAKEGNAIGIISAGIWPGVSSLLAKNLINSAKKKNLDVDECRFTFFTAGSGGAGETILTATFLLLGEDVLAYENGKATYSFPGTKTLVADFGPEIGPRKVANLNLIECESCFVSNLGTVKNVSTYFGTAPGFWNDLFVLMTLFPKKLLQNRYNIIFIAHLVSYPSYLTYSLMHRKLMQKFAALSLPLVRLVDLLVGSKNGIRVDIRTSDGGTKFALLTHKDLEDAVGKALSLFAEQVLFNTAVGKASKRGVFFPEEIENDEYLEYILKNISVDDNNCIKCE